MELNKYQQQIFDKLKPVIENFGIKNRAWAIFFLLWIGLGGYALYLQVAKGHEVTGMRDNVVWGLYIANFIFFIGISYAGAVISGILHILKVEWRKPHYPYCRNDHGYFYYYWPCIYFIMCGPVRQASSSFPVSKASVAHNLGRICYSYLFYRKCNFPLPRFN
jgi:hypothetical protein